MAESKLKIDVRREKILAALRENCKVSVSELSRELGATPVTIRNDLSALERDGYLTRVSGGAVILSRDREVRPEVANLAEKQAIAKAVAAMIRPGDTLFINSGTTAQAVTAELKKKRNLNVVTNCVAVAIELSAVPAFRVILLGGELNPQYGFTYGGDAQEQLGRYSADWAILAADGISAMGGVTTYHAEEAIIDRLMISAAKRTIIAADHTKLGRAGFSRVAGISDRICLVTDKLGESQESVSLREAGAQVIFA